MNIDLNIVLFGLDCYSENLGCSALAYSFFSLLNEELEKQKKKAKVYITIIDEDEQDVYPSGNYTSLEFETLFFRYKKKDKLSKIFSAIRGSDFIFDFTGGDSFSDIYGMRRFLKGSILKSYCIKKGKRLVLGPQTYGPFKTIIAKIWAKSIIKHSFVVFARDKQSYSLCKSVRKNDVYSVCDVAFSLPYKKNHFEADKINIGINVSGLLYAGGYSGNNQFRLKVKYKDYIDRLIENISKDKRYRIYLVPHVICNDYDNVENDLKVCNLLKEKYALETDVPVFNNPIDAKTFISGLDIFTGARMHATIAAFSSNVATIPFSYSKKFIGLYAGVNYPYYIDAKSLSTEDAVAQTLQYIHEDKVLLEAIGKSLKLVNSFRSELHHVLETKNEE